MKRTIEIEDNLQEIIDSTIEDVKQLLLDYLKDNPDTDELPCINNDLDYSGSVHEIIDSAVPIYTREIEGLWYFYGNDFEKAFDDAGFERDGEWPSGWQAAAIYCYIEQEVQPVVSR